ncbi:unnamed protein product, partial [Ixodes pacificus]
MFRIWLLYGCAECPRIHLDRNEQADVCISGNVQRHRKPSLKHEPADQSGTYGVWKHTRVPNAPELVRPAKCVADMTRGIKSDIGGAPKTPRRSAGCCQRLMPVQ